MYFIVLFPSNEPWKLVASSSFVYCLKYICQGLFHVQLERFNRVRTWVGALVCDHVFHHRCTCSSRSWDVSGASCTSIVLISDVQTGNEPIVLWLASSCLLKTDD